MLQKMFFLFFYFSLHPLIASDCPGLCLEGEGYLAPLPTSSSINFSWKVRGTLPPTDIVFNQFLLCGWKVAMNNCSGSLVCIIRCSPLHRGPR